jgi:ribonuclease P protein component
MPVANSYPGSSNKFPGSARVKRRGEILSVQNNGRKLFSRHFLVSLLAARGTSSRLAVTVTKKVDKRSSARNRLRRRIREIFRLTRFKLSSLFDIVIIARNGACELEYAEIRRELLGTLKHHKLLK